MMTFLFKIGWRRRRALTLKRNLYSPEKRRIGLHRHTKADMKAADESGTT